MLVAAYQTVGYVATVAQALHLGLPHLDECDDAAFATSLMAPFMEPDVDADDIDLIEETEGN